jgi:hypothetical protein
MWGGSSFCVFGPPSAVCASCVSLFCAGCPQVFLFFLCRADSFFPQEQPCVPAYSRLAADTATPHAPRATARRRCTPPLHTQSQQRLGPYSQRLKDGGARKACGGHKRRLGHGLVGFPGLSQSRAAAVSVSRRCASLQVGSARLGPARAPSLHYIRRPRLITSLLPPNQPQSLVLCWQGAAQQGDGQVPRQARL